MFVFFIEHLSFELYFPLNIFDFDFSVTRVSYKEIPTPEEVL